MIYSAPIHHDPLLTLEIIDEQWASETLPVEDVMVPTEDMPNFDDEEEPTQPDGSDVEKWGDLSLGDMAADLGSDSPAQDRPVNPLSNPSSSRFGSVR